MKASKGPTVSPWGDLVEYGLILLSLGRPALSYCMSAPSSKKWILIILKLASFRTPDIN